MSEESDHLAEYEAHRLQGYRRSEPPPTQLASLQESACYLIDACAARRGVHIGPWKMVKGRLLLRPDILKPYTREVLAAYGEIHKMFLGTHVDGDEVARARVLFESIEARCRQVLARTPSGIGASLQRWGRLTAFKKQTGPRKDVELPPRDWFTSLVAFYRPLAFFQHGPFSRKSDAQVAEDLYAEEVHTCMETYPGPPAADHRELRALAEDPKRVWWQDTEADVCPGNEEYVETLGEWARISRGAFSPGGVVERWEGEKGPVVVEFTLAGTRHRITPEYLDDYIDTGVLSQINRIIAPSGLRFEGIWPVDQSMFIVVLTPEEKQRIERERGLKFVVFE